MKMQELRRLIRIHRQNQGISQERLALLANVSLRTINKFESGRAGLQGDSLLSVMEALGFQIAEPNVQVPAKPKDPLVRLREDMDAKIEEARRLAESALMLAARRGRDGEEERAAPREDSPSPPLPLDLGRRL